MQNIEKIRHSLAHLLAAAVIEIYPEAKPTIGPVIENGFYYDFELLSPISDKDLGKIEQKMREIVKSWEIFKEIEVTADEARKIFTGNPYKLELINELADKGEKITLYYSGPKDGDPSKSDFNHNSKFIILVSLIFAEADMLNPQKKFQKTAGSFKELPALIGEAMKKIKC